MNKKVRLNEQIWAREVRLIDENGEQVGIVSREEAMRIARDRNLDLIEVSPHSHPPVCRIANYDKFRFYLAKKEKERRLHSKKVALKEVRFGIRTGEHDLNFKRKKIREFLEEGRKVKAEIVLRGREHQYRDLARTAFNEFLDKLKNDVDFKMDQPILSGPHGFYCILIK